MVIRDPSACHLIDENLLGLASYALIVPHQFVPVALEDAIEPHADLVLQEFNIRDGIVVAGAHRISFCIRAARGVQHMNDSFCHPQCIQELIAQALA